MSIKSIDVLIPDLVYRLGMIIHDPESTTNEVLRAGRIIADLDSNHLRKQEDQIKLGPIDEGSPF